MDVKNHSMIEFLSEAAAFVSTHSNIIIFICLARVRSFHFKRVICIQAFNTVYVNLFLFVGFLSLVPLVVKLIIIVKVQQLVLVVVAGDAVLVVTQEQVLLFT